MKKELNFELNILPILDILSVLICFLLLTAVWVQVSSLDTKQAVGDNSTNGKENPPSLWIQVASNGGLKLQLRDVKGKGPLEDSVQSSSAGVNWAQLDLKLQVLKNRIPDLKTVVIRPEAKANYGEVIELMDKLKKNQLSDVGLSPLG